MWVKPTFLALFMREGFVPANSPNKFSQFLKKCQKIEVTSNGSSSQYKAELGDFLSISISTNSLGLLSISTFINSTQADSYQYQLNLSCSNQLINEISTFIPKLLFFSQKLLFQAYLLGNSHVELVQLILSLKNWIVWTNQGV